MSASGLRPDAGTFVPSAAPSLRAQQSAPHNQPASTWQSFRLPLDPHLSNYHLITRDPTESTWHGTLLWESYFSTFPEDDRTRPMVLELDSRAAFAYPPNTIIPPPLGEIRMDSDGNERMYQIEGLGLLTATQLAELEEERRQRAERRGEKFERRPRQLIRHRHEWTYHHPDHAGERRWRGLTDPERDPSDHAIFQRRRRREDRGPGPRPLAVEAHREQQRKMREYDGDLAATRREVLEMVRGDLEDHQQRVAAALTTPPPPHAFYTQLEYITSVSLVIQHHRQQRQHQHEQRQQQQQQQQQEQHYHQQQHLHQNQHQNDPQRQRSNLRPEEEEHEKQQEWTFLPSYELRQATGQESWETNSKTAEHLKRLAQSHLPSGYYQEIRDDLALLETLLADHPNKTFYQGIYGDLKRWKQGIAAGVAKRPTVDNRLRYLQHLMTCHRPPGPHAEMHDDLFFLMRLEEDHEPAGYYEEIYSDLLVMRRLSHKREFRVELRQCLNAVKVARWLAERYEAEPTRMATNEDLLDDVLCVERLLPVLRRKHYETQQWIDLAGVARDVDANGDEGWYPRVRDDLARMQRKMLLAACFEWVLEEHTYIYTDQWTSAALYPSKPATSTGVRSLTPTTSTDLDVTTAAEPSTSTASTTGYTIFGGPGTWDAAAFNASRSFFSTTTTSVGISSSWHQPSSSLFPPPTTRPLPSSVRTTSRSPNGHARYARHEPEASQLQAICEGTEADHGASSSAAETSAGPSRRAQAPIGTPKQPETSLSLSTTRGPS